MKNQALFSSKIKVKKKEKLKCRLLQCLFGALRVNQGQRFCRGLQQDIKSRIMAYPKV